MTRRSFRAIAAVAVAWIFVERANVCVAQSSSSSIVTLPEGRGLGEVGVIHGDVRAYDTLPSFAVDAAGNLVVADSVNSRIQIFDRTGALTSVITPDDPAELPSFPSEFVLLPGERIV